PGSTPSSRARRRGGCGTSRPTRFATTRRTRPTSCCSPTPTRTRARSKARTLPSRDAGPRGAPPRVRRRVDGRGMVALAIVPAGVPPAVPRRARPLPGARPAARAALQQCGGSLLAGEDDYPARGARLLRPLWGAMDARVSSRSDRHRDAARDDRLRPRLGRGAAVRGTGRLVAPSLRPLRQLRAGDGRELVRAWSEIGRASCRERV